MARPLRIEYDGAWYHVMNRGLDRMPIFLNDTHRHIFLELLIEIFNRYQAEIHAYCLMGNHYHLLIRTPLGNLSRMMRHLDGVYTQKFNRLVKRDGPLFRGRYKAILVEADVYLLRLSRYIHLNPVQAKLVEKPQNYQWSSYRAFLTGNAPCWLNTRHTLSHFGENQEAWKYQQFVDECIDGEIDDISKLIKKSPVLGTEDFTKIVTEKYLKEEHKIADIPDHKLLFETKPKHIDIAKIQSTVAAFYDVDPDEIINAKKAAMIKLRWITMYLALMDGQYTFTQISQHFGMTLSGVSRACGRLRVLMDGDDGVRAEVMEMRENMMESRVKT